jgi:hypothetical protein
VSKQIYKEQLIERREENFRVEKHVNDIWGNNLDAQFSLNVPAHLRN